MKARRVLQIVADARDLVSEEGDNHEYDRALVEMTVRLLAMSYDDRELVARVIGVRP